MGMVRFVLFGEENATGALPSLHTKILCAVEALYSRFCKATSIKTHLL